MSESATSKIDPGTWGSGPVVEFIAQKLDEMQDPKVKRSVFHLLSSYTVLTAKMRTIPDMDLWITLSKYVLKDYTARVEALPVDADLKSRLCNFMATRYKKEYRSRQSERVSLHEQTEHDLSSLST